MRVAYVINSLEGGGASGPVPAVVDVLRSQGCDVRVLALTMRDGRGLSAIEQKGISVLVRERGETNHLGALQWLDRQILDWQPDVIWTSLTRATLLGQIIGQLRGIDVVSWQHSAYLKPINALLLKLRHRRSIFWVADSESVAALTRRRLGVAPDRIAVWPLFAADMSAPQATPWQPGMPLRIGSLGRLHPAKGYDVLIAALGRLRADGFTAPVPIEIEIAGDGALREALMAQASALGVSDLRLIGFSKPKPFLASLHLYVQPSRREGLCIAAHEAMQARLPVLASAVGELAHTIIDRVTGRLVPPLDPTALASALADLLRNPGRLGVMGEASRKRVLDLFGDDAFARAGIAVLHQIRQLRETEALAPDQSASRARTGRSSSHRST